MGWLSLLILKPAIGINQLAPSQSKVILGHCLFFIIGFWGTLVGAGFLSLGSLVLLTVFHKTFLQSASVLLFVGLAVGLTGLLIFGLNDAIHWPIGLTLLAGKTLGGYFGAKFAIQVGDTWIRRLFFLVVCLAIATLVMT